MASIWEQTFGGSSMAEVEYANYTRYTACLASFVSQKAFLRFLCHNESILSFTTPHSSSNPPLTASSAKSRDASPIKTISSTCHMYWMHDGLSRESRSKLDWRWLSQNVQKELLIVKTECSNEKASKTKTCTSSIPTNSSRFIISYLTYIQETSQIRWDRGSTIQLH